MLLSLGTMLDSESGKQGIKQGRTRDIHSSSLHTLTKASGLGAINAPNPLMSSSGNSDNHGQLDALKDAVSSETSKWTVHRFVDALPDGLGFYLTVLKP